MKKSERLQDLMIYLNDKNSFHLKDIMLKYQISKSTALRDIESIESIGMPIYTKQGRNGYYGILANRMLSPIIFSIDEMYALYFAMLALNDYQSTPFHLSMSTLKNKFELCLSKERKEELHKMEQILKMSGIKHFHESPFLKDIMTLSIENKVCAIEYQKNSTAQSYDVQFFSISSSFGQWYATAYLFPSKKTIVFRCDKILSVQESMHYKGEELFQANVVFNASSKFYRHEGAINFEVEITKKGVDIFYKEHYPSMELKERDGRFFIEGFYNPKEFNFITAYFIPYGKQILSIAPTELKKGIVDALHTLSTYYKKL